ncbi:unnamed protein product [Chironomus riparius]|uniref:Uncharacterized protein n=1 Tax=Chironomus riparius TaxID=315576 RepID=A0A9N9RKT1_9DIPT|nr:unnamed protein product [Chironomus riparius]
MEACEEQHLNNSTSNSEEKQSDSFNSSELDDAMNDLLTQDIQESQNDSLVTQEEDLLDMMKEKSVRKNAMQKLNVYTAKKILRRAKYLKEKNYYFISNKNYTWNHPTRERHSIQKIRARETLDKLDETTSQKIKKVVKSGDLTIQRLCNLGHQIPLISKTKFITPSSLLNVSSYESGQSSLTPESFPKAIVYPDSKKLNVQPMKATEHGRMSFNEVFTKATEEQIQTQKTIEKAVSKTDSRKKPRNRDLASKHKGSSKIESVIVENESSEKQPVKYLIPQNLLASQNDELSTDSIKNDCNASTSKSNRNSVSSDENLDISHSVIPDRPQINFDLIDALADYRVIARYLFNKLDVSPIDFDGTDDYINLYKLSRN